MLSKGIPDQYQTIPDQSVLIIPSIPNKPWEYQVILGNPQGQSDFPDVVRLYLDKGDQNLMSNMHKHAKNCWGDENVRKALETKGELSVDVHKGLALTKLHDGSITASFEERERCCYVFNTATHLYGNQVS